jgi:4-amino-4-deoxy-L-arabinose transferase-like glycosyltransferase
MKTQASRLHHEESGGHSMLQRLRGRNDHYLLLVLAWVLLSLVNLGTSSLWDIDEGNNGECAREMYEAGNWVVPTFNFGFRVDKPALLYWMQMSCYHVFGINEFSARLPSALAALLAVLLTYQIGRKMFGEGAGFLSSLMLLSSMLFCGAAHFANPDALLCACTTLTFLIFWNGLERGDDRWMLHCGISTGLAMLAKGPVGIVLPGMVISLYLLWARQLRRLFRPALVWGLLIFLLVSAPWYAWVGAETRGEFLRGFFLKHNLSRFNEAMENHSGPIFYYLIVLLIGFAPWSIFFGLAGWHSRQYRGDPRYRFLFCWIGVYLVFFSVSKTKLPNYVLPIYPPIALLTGHFLDRWRRGKLTLPAWGMPISLGCLALTGVLTTAGLLIAGGAIGESLTRGRHLAGLENWAFVGIVPIIGAIVGWWYWRKQNPAAILSTLGLTAVAWLGLLFAGGQPVINRHKAPQALGDALQANAPAGDIHVGCFQYFQPSLVFYFRHRIEPILTEENVVDWLRYPVPTYVVLPASIWDRLRPEVPGSPRELSRQRDLYRGIDVVLVSNR